MKITDEMVDAVLKTTDAQLACLWRKEVEIVIAAVAPLILENAALLVEAEAVTIGAQTGSSIWVALHGAAQAIRALATKEDGA